MMRIFDQKSVRTTGRLLGCAMAVVCGWMSGGEAARATTLPPSAVAMSSTVLVRNLYIESGESMAGNETGAVLDIRDGDGNPYILTARHGLAGEDGQPYEDERGVQIYALSGKMLGTAHIAYCDPFSRGGNPQDGDIVVHDQCVLSMDKTTPDYAAIQGYHIPNALTPGPIQLCHDGLISWEAGASGSPLFSDKSTLHGILSVVFHQQSMPVDEWRKALRDRNIAEPVRLPGDTDGEKRPVVHASCGLFVPPSPSILIFLGIDPQKISWNDDQARSFPSWANVSLPNLRESYITN